MNNAPKLKDLTGMKFGEWTVLNRTIGRKDSRGYPLTTWRCRCSCGTERDVLANTLMSGRSSSCGCKQKEISKSICRENFYKHGECQTRLYEIWCGMKKRCNNPNAYNYSNYGGRGITVCESWQEYVSFKEWALTNGYTDELSIDRIDVNKGYSPENCRWVDGVAQANNRRSTRHVEYNGKTYTISELASILNKPYSLVWKYLKAGKPLSLLYEQ